MLTQPLLIGIRSGSTLLALQPVPVTCSIEDTSLVSSMEWVVNGRKILEDTKLFTDSEKVTSNWIYVPEMNDVVVECKVKGDESRSVFVFFTVNTEQKQVNSEDSSYSSNHGTDVFKHLQLLLITILYFIDNSW